MPAFACSINSERKAKPFTTAPTAMMTTIIKA